MSTILKITRSIDNDIWKIVFSVDSAKFSETDKQLIAKFGEPEINVGGVFLEPTPGQENAVYSSIGGTSAVGAGAVFTITRNALGAVSTVVLGVGVSPGGSGYAVGNTITIPGTAIGGTSPADNLVITVSTVAIATAGTKAQFSGQVAGMTSNVLIRADNVGTAGNSIMLAFDGVEDLDTVVSNTAGVTLISGDGSQVPDNGEEITLSGGVADLMGVATFTFTGGGTLGPIPNPNTFTLPDKYIKIRSGLPFVQEFDSRGTSGIFSANTQLKAEAYQTEIVSRYTAALTALRANIDGFTGEFLVNI